MGQRLDPQPVGFRGSGIAGFPGPSHPLHQDHCQGGLGASVPPERLLKARTISLYSMRSERAFYEVFEYNLLFRWFFDMNLMERGFDPTVSKKNRQRLVRCWG